MWKLSEMLLLLHLWSSLGNLLPDTAVCSDHNILPLFQWDILMPYKFIKQICYSSCKRRFCIIPCQEKSHDLPVKSGISRYQSKDGSYETIEGNSGICCFIWEHLIVVNWILQHLQKVGATVSTKKFVLATPDTVIITTSVPSMVTFLMRPRSRRYKIDQNVQQCCMSAASSVGVESFIK